MPETTAMVADLRRPEAYPASERPADVTLVETHISWIFMTGRFVYKVKKPVDLGFLDFTTVEKRRHYCHQEVVLNRRLAPETYLGVAEVREEEGRHTIDGPGATVEYAVKMRQLPHERAMAELVPRGEVTVETVERVAERVQRFHEAAETGEAITRGGDLDAVRFDVQENFDQTERYVGITVSPAEFAVVRAYSEAFLEVRAALFERRATEGRVRDCHGDLHLAHVFLVDGIQVIDCIEFNERFRYDDVACDLAFLAMDLDHAGRPDLSRALVEAYVAKSEDRELPLLLDFYKCYRAYVRGKVTSFRLDDPLLTPDARETAVREARGYFALAADYARPRGPVLVITAGLMGVGKSVVAHGVAGALGGVALTSDVLRKEMVGAPPTERRYDDWGAGLYAPEEIERTYDELRRQASAALAGGRSVVLDASHGRASWREAARAVARDAGAPFLALECTAPREVVRERLGAREARGGSPSDGRWDLYDRQQASFEPLDEVAPAERVVVDTSGAESETIAAALRGAYLALLGTEAPTAGAARGPTQAQKTGV